MTAPVPTGVGNNDISSVFNSGNDGAVLNPPGNTSPADFALLDQVDQFDGLDTP